MDQEKTQEEYQRLKTLFKDVDDNKTQLVDGLLLKAAFLKVQLDEFEDIIRKSGAIQFSNKGNARETPVYQTFLKTLSVYQGIIKTLGIVMGKNAISEDDEFDEFLKNVSR